jgi:hypothetical protein
VHWENENASAPRGLGLKTPPNYVPAGTSLEVFFSGETLHFEEKKNVMEKAPALRYDYFDSL